MVMMMMIMISKLQEAVLLQKGQANLHRYSLRAMCT
jgi:hypothetical protein